MDKVNNPKTTQKQKAKEIGCSDSTIQTNRNGKNRFGPNLHDRPKHDCCFQSISGTDSRWDYTTCNLVENLGWQLTKTLSIAGKQKSKNFDNLIT